MLAVKALLSSRNVTQFCFSCEIIYFNMIALKGPYIIESPNIFKKFTIVSVLSSMKGVVLHQWYDPFSVYIFVEIFHSKKKQCSSKPQLSMKNTRYSLIFRSYQAQSSSQPDPIWVTGWRAGANIMIRNIVFQYL